MTGDQGLAALQEAAASEHGLLLRASNVEAVVAALSRIARRSARPELLSLRFKRVSRAEGNLIILHGPQEEEAAEGPGLADL